MARIQVSGGPIYKVDTTHPLVNVRVIKKRNINLGQSGTILGIRIGANVRGKNAFVIKYDNGEITLISRVNFEVIK